MASEYRQGRVWLGKLSIRPMTNAPLFLFVVWGPDSSVTLEMEGRII